MRRLSSPLTPFPFCPTDPRVVLIPVPASQARALGCKVYSLSKDPFKFQEAVVAGTQESYYGECRFQMETDAPGYLKMDRNSLKGLFGNSIRPAATWS